MWLIDVKCVAAVVVCLLQGTPDLGKNSFATYRECDRALREIAGDWKPPSGEYRFNCRRVI